MRLEFSERTVEKTPTFSVDQEVLHSILQSMSTGLGVADKTGHFLAFNRAAKCMVGIEPADVEIADWSRHFGIYLPDKVTLYPPNELPLARAMAGEDVDENELFLRNNNIPQGRWISVNARPLRNVDGTIAGGVCVFRDITDRKRTDALNAAQVHVLDLLSKDIPLESVLNDLLRSIEQEIPGGRTSRNCSQKCGSTSRRPDMVAMSR